MGILSKIITENNRIYSTLNTFNNVNIPQVNAMFQGFGIDEGNISTSHLNVAQLGMLMQYCSDFVKIMAKETKGNRKHEVYLSEAGYESTQALIDNLDTLMSNTSSRAIVQKNFVKMKETLDVLDSVMEGFISNASLNSMLAGIVLVKNKIVSATTSLDKVEEV